MSYFFLSLKFEPPELFKQRMSDEQFLLNIIFTCPTRQGFGSLRLVFAHRGVAMTREESRISGWVGVQLLALNLLNTQQSDRVRPLNSIRVTNDCFLKFLKFPRQPLNGSISHKKSHIIDVHIFWNNISEHC